MQQGTVEQELQLIIDELRLQGKQATKKLIDHMEKDTLLKSKVSFVLNLMKIIIIKTFYFNSYLLC
ncbi:hypothetical protein bthur0004_8330 [Bacillus thuringiensis serovar sotto str. T04001]|nr:hypothetical protein bthur0004_8330 [Bacillus thuringiensis serovar sotto str. T04001]